MEAYLITMTTHRRVRPDVNDVTRVLLAARDKTGTALLLGRKGSMRRIPNEHAYTHEQLMRAAQEGLLYLEERQAMAFAPDLDAGTKLPVLLEDYHEAFRRRQLDNAKPADVQMQITPDRP